MRRYELVVLFAAILLGLALRLHLYGGIVGLDDLRHAFHGYFLFENEDTKYGDLTPHTEHLHIRTHYSRMGMNIPIWLATHIFGVHEWAFSLVSLIPSLLGIIFVALTARELAGPVAGLFAGTLWACLPVDIYFATVLWQDDMYASLFTLYLLLVVVAEKRENRWTWAALVSAGLVLGYMQYVKEGALFVLFVTGLWAGWRCVANRTVLWRYALIAIGFLATQALMGLVFLYEQGDFLWYYRFLFGSTIRELVHFYTPWDIVVIYLRLLWVRDAFGWQFGYSVVAAPLLLTLGFLPIRGSLRVLLALLWLGQVYVIYWPSVITPNIRYLLQISPLYVLCMALGAAWLVARIPRRARPAGAALLLVTAALSSAAPLDVKHQRYARHLGDGYREVFAALKNTANPDSTETVYVDPVLPIRTQRALYQFNGFNRPLGGFKPIEGALEADSGWVVVSTSDASLRHRVITELPDNWLEVFAHRFEPGTYDRGWMALFKILPRCREPGMLPVFPGAGPLTLRSVNIPCATSLPFSPITLDQPARTYGFKTGEITLDAERYDGRLHFRIGAEGAKPDNAVAGFRLPAPHGVRAFRCKIGVAPSEAVYAVYVAVRDRRSKVLMHWMWRVAASTYPRPMPTEYTLVPGQNCGPFYFHGNETLADRGRAVTVVVRRRTEDPVDLVLTGAAIAPCRNIATTRNKGTNPPNPGTQPDTNSDGDG